MKGSPSGWTGTLPLQDLTHEIPGLQHPWEASYRLYPDPQPLAQRHRLRQRGGSRRRHRSPLGGAQTARAATTHRQPGQRHPDPGGRNTLASGGAPDERSPCNRLRNLEKSSHLPAVATSTPAGRGFASSVISFEQVGPCCSAEVVTIPYQPAVAEKDGTLRAPVPILDVQYGKRLDQYRRRLARQGGGSAKGDNACIRISGRGCAGNMRARPLRQQLRRCATRPAAGLPQQPAAGLRWPSIWTASPPNIRCNPAPTGTSAQKKCGWDSTFCRYDTSFGVVGLVSTALLLGGGAFAGPAGYLENRLSSSLIKKCRHAVWLTQ